MHIGRLLDMYKHYKPQSLQVEKFKWKTKAELSSVTTVSIKANHDKHYFLFNILLLLNRRRRKPLLLKMYKMSINLSLQILKVLNQIQFKTLA